MAAVVSGHAVVVGREELLPPITVDDVDKALSTTKPSARLYAERYNKFHEEYGQVH